jgi:hypothetical protein
VALVTMVIGIGGSTALFSVVDGTCCGPSRIRMPNG